MINQKNRHPKSGDLLFEPGSRTYSTQSKSKTSLLTTEYKRSIIIYLCSLRFGNPHTCRITDIILSKEAAEEIGTYLNGISDYYKSTVPVVLQTCQKHIQSILDKRV